MNETKLRTPTSLLEKENRANILYTPD
uniref:Uncharacterized protein n=1 Tax=Rhizophora mucronata TaxID=61149 RepID=A0A2P2PHN1_RHIMU